MADKKRRQKRDYDFAVTTFRVVQEATGQIGPPEQNKPRKEYDYKALWYEGGLKGGSARADKLTPEQRRQIAKKAALTRWKTKA